VIGAQWLGSTGVDETFAGQLLYDGNRIAQISAAFRTPFYTFAEVVGTLGRLHLSMPFVGANNSVLTFHSSDGDPEVIPYQEEYLYLGEIEDMNAAILDDAPNYLSLQETRNHVKTILALYESAREGKVVHLKNR
jgi:predicted dehydrogenase